MKRGGFWKPSHSSSGKAGHIVLTFAIVSLLIISSTLVWAQFGGGGGGGSTTGFTITQISPSLGSDVAMGNTATFVFQIKNTSSSKVISQVRFQLPSPGSTFSSGTAAPANWSRTSFSASSVTFQASNSSNGIAPNATLNFTLLLAVRSTSQDVTETLSNVKATYSDSGSGRWRWSGSNSSSSTIYTPGSWKIKSLLASFQITDTLGNPITATRDGVQFRLIMTVTNRSTVTQSSIVTFQNPPTVTGTTQAGASLNSTQYNPNPLNLTAGASGTITFTYTGTLGGTSTSGTVTFSAYAKNSSGNATSSPVSSITFGVSRFFANLAVSPTCAYLGQDITVTMALTNTFSGPPPTNNITNVTPTLTLPGAPATLVSGPTPAAPSGPVASAGGTFVFSWTYRPSGGNLGDSVIFSGFATGTKGGATVTTPNSPTPSVSSVFGGYTITVDPTDTNASSTNQAVSWTFVNQGCAAVKSVSISYPAGWSYGGDAYSLIENSAGNLIETWTASGTNPVVFTAPSVAERLMIGGAGDFRLVFTGTPATTGVSSFTSIITDANDRADTDVIPITVNPFNSDSLNESDIKTYREDFR
ncbi:MAG: hypothetical protein HY282_13660 [Nitrospirae bacterium]|nr:hypothetical protein [Candidatus Manganitrophaceae bacterium]